MGPYNIQDFSTSPLMVPAVSRTVLLSYRQLLLTYKSANLTVRNWNKKVPLNSINQLIFVMVKCGVLFEVRTEFLNNI
jgi:hypothetical protein